MVMAISILIWNMCCASRFSFNSWPRPDLRDRSLSAAIVTIHYFTTARKKTTNIWRNPTLSQLKWCRSADGFIREGRTGQRARGTKRQAIPVHSRQRRRRKP